MTQKDKKLLLKDLCGRLPYEVKMNHVADNDITPTTLVGIAKNMITLEDNGGYATANIDEYKPYLFPMSSMTEEQTFEIRSYLNSIEGRMIGMQGRAIYTIDWLNQHHFDHRGLIEKGLAIDATNLNVY